LTNTAKSLFIKISKNP